jgi:YegS/Rv2252/BmrU family lipid kinase
LGSIALVANPTSGRGAAARVLPSAISRLQSLGHSVEVLTSTSANHATELAAAASVRHPVVAAVGGDGMVAFVANGVLGTSAAFGIVPTGTGNDFARALGYDHRDPLAACAVLSAGVTRMVDVGRIEGGRAFLCVAGGGFDSEANRAANRIKWLRGTPVYVAAVLRTLASFRPAQFTVTLDGSPISFEGMFVDAGNAQSYGGGMRIAPDADLSDGLLDVVMIGKLGRLQLFGQFPKLFKGTHINHAAVKVRRARRVTIEADRPFFLYADGEEVGPLPATLSIEPSALKVIVV